MPFPSPGDLPDPGIEPRSPAFQADSLQTEPSGKPDPLAGDQLDVFQWEYVHEDSVVENNTLLCYLLWSICILKGALKVTLTQSDSCSLYSRLVGKAYSANLCVRAQRGSLRIQEDAIPVAESPKQDKAKAKPPKTHINHINKNQTQSFSVDKIFTSKISSNLIASVLIANSGISKFEFCVPKDCWIPHHV